MTRQTSIEAYNTIKENGLLSKRRWEVYQTLYEHGPLSQVETSFSLRGKLDWGINPRFSELKKMGLIIEVGKTIDPRTGQTVLLWDVTSNLPKKFEKPKRFKCNACAGKGYFEESQGRLF